jgi:hypothetical protein
VTAQFRNLAQTRFKLLGLLPVGTLGTLAIVEHQAPAHVLRAPRHTAGGAKGGRCVPRVTDSSNDRARSRANTMRVVPRSEPRGADV